MDWSICPICDSAVPSLELERHANGHFEDEELAREIQLAEQVELAYCNSFGTVHNAVACATTGQMPESSSARCGGNSKSGQGNDLDEELLCLKGLQTGEMFYRVGDGLIALLSDCLILDSENSTSILSGYVDHFQSIESEDVGWGCGWRNIQMLSSHLLKQRPDVRQVLFGGSGFVPGIASLQRWLEIAWKKGFDKLGSEHFHHEIYGKRNWIGTPECAALFRSFGLRARIIDFDSEGITLASSVLTQQSKRTTIKLLGPMDKFFVPSEGDQDKSQAGTNGQKHSDLKMRGHQVLVDWVWNYFSDNKPMILGTRHVICTEKVPLYFQHDGHSRTIVGIQVKHQIHGMRQFNLLILDPSHKTQALETSLKANSGWQKLIKRGVHTLKKSQYQLCYIDPGIARGEELEDLKILDSDYYRI